MTRRCCTHQPETEASESISGFCDQSACFTLWPKISKWFKVNDCLPCLIHFLTHSFLWFRKKMLGLHKVLAREMRSLHHKLDAPPQRFQFECVMEEAPSVPCAAWWSSDVVKNIQSCMKKTVYKDQVLQLLQSSLLDTVEKVNAVWCLNMELKLSQR